jgi:membrane-bound lytic murein transglycosylase MltF
MGATIAPSTLRVGLMVGAMAAVIAAAGCGGSPQPASDPAPAATPSPVADTPEASATPADVVPPTTATVTLPDDVRAIASTRFTGDLDGMVKRRLIRLGVAYNRTFFFVDRGMQRGVSYEYGKLFEEDLNKRLKTGNLKVHVMFVPLPRPMLASSLANGEIDAVVAQVTVTPERRQLVDFSNPTRRDVDEVVVTGPGAPPIASVSDLSGREVFVRQGSTYHQSLVALNERLAAQGRPPAVVRFAPDNLEDDDLLEMTNAGLIPITIVDDYLAEFWKHIFTDLTVHDTVTVRSGGELAVAFRKNSPQFAAAANQFLAKNGLGSVFGNIVERRYFDSKTFAKNAASAAERQKFLKVVELFKKYGDRYDMDYLLMGAQGYQESRLDHTVRSPAGAVGIMQLMPATGRELKVGDVTQLEANIHAGVKYMRFLVDQYFKDEPMDRLNRGLFAFAAYNAGPARIRQLRNEARERGLDPNVWFGQVEQVASERIGRETVTYVSNIYKYYVAYKLISEERARRDAAKATLTPAGK